MPSGILHMLEFDYSVNQREDIRDNAPEFGLVSTIVFLDITLGSKGTHMKAVENTSPSFMRLALDMCSCVMTGRGKINMYKSKIMPSTDCTIPQ